MSKLKIALFWALLPVPTLAQTLLADIPPVASLVAQVTQGVAEPALIADGNFDPHGGTLRPSDARALARAEVIFWVGPDLSPWLQAPLDSLSQDAVIVTLADAPGVIARPFRRDAVFDAHDDHGHRDDDHDDHDHDHGDHDAQDHGDDHDHGDFDPHLWLDPVNARAFVAEIARVMALHDPENAALYAANAAAAETRLAALEEELAAMLEGTAPRVVMDHDSLGHFEDRFGISAIGAVSDSDAARPGPRRVDAVRRAASEAGAVCLLVEPGQGGRPAVEGLRVVEIDPLGLTAAPGPGLYDQTLRAVAGVLAGCSDGTPE